MTSRQLLKRAGGFTVIGIWPARGYLAEMALALAAFAIVTSSFAGNHQASQEIGSASTLVSNLMTFAYLISAVNASFTAESIGGRLKHSEALVRGMTHNKKSVRDFARSEMSRLTVDYVQNPKSSYPRSVWAMLVELEEDNKLRASQALTAITSLMVAALGFVVAGVYGSFVDCVLCVVLRVCIYASTLRILSAGISLESRARLAEVSFDDPPEKIKACKE